MRPPMKWGERIQSTGAAHGGSGRRSESAASENGAALRPLRVLAPPVERCERDGLL